MQKDNIYLDMNIVSWISSIISAIARLFSIAGFVLALALAVFILNRRLARRQAPAPPITESKKKEMQAKLAMLMEDRRGQQAQVGVGRGAGLGDQLPLFPTFSLWPSRPSLSQSRFEHGLADKVLDYYFWCVGGLLQVSEVGHDLTCPYFGIQVTASARDSSGSKTSKTSKTDSSSRWTVL